MWRHYTGLLIFIVATSALEQGAQVTDFSAITDLRARIEAVHAARKQLAGRTDSPAVTEWDQILTEMHLSHDPELSSAVKELRALKLYDNSSWTELVSLGYVYLEAPEQARLFHAEVVHMRPDSAWAIQEAIQQWESTHRPRNTMAAGFIEWAGERVKFLKRLHEDRPLSASATSEYLSAALQYETHLSTDEALAVADLALHARDAAALLGFDPRFLVPELYLHHHARLEEVPGLLNDALLGVERETGDGLASDTYAEKVNQEIAWAQLRSHSDLAEFWLQKDDIEQARSMARLASADLARLAPTPDTPHNRRAVYQDAEERWAKLATRLGMEPAGSYQPRQVDWNKVARVPLGDFQATDLNGGRWTLRDWNGKVVLVNMWATWCTPCRAELPYVQKLYDSFRGRADRLVISIDVDADAEMARRLIHEHGYTFPVLNSRRLADHIDFVNGVPQNRIVDAHSRLLLEPVDGTGDAWVDMVKTIMDDVK
jgi:thiol-disulfide isomerase/thioredoxin